MNEEKILAIHTDVQKIVDEHIQQGHEIYGMCLEVSKNYSKKIQALIKTNLPEFTNQNVNLVMGNLAFNEELMFGEVAAKFYANNPGKSKIDVKPGQYHAWLEFEEMIIDLTVLYTLSLFNKATKPAVLFSNNKDIFFPNDIGFRYVAYRYWPT